MNSFRGTVLTNPFKKHKTYSNTYLSLSYPGTPKIKKTTIFEVGENNFEDNINKMKELLQKLPDVAYDEVKISKCNNCNIQYFESSENRTNNRKGYNDIMRLYDQSLLYSLEEKTSSVNNQNDIARDECCSLCIEKNGNQLENNDMIDIEKNTNSTTSTVVSYSKHFSTEDISSLQSSKKLNKCGGKISVSNKKSKKKRKCVLSGQNKSQEQNNNDGTITKKKKRLSKEFNLKKKNTKLSNKETKPLLSTKSKESNPFFNKKGDDKIKKLYYEQTKTPLKKNYTSVMTNNSSASNRTNMSINSDTLKIPMDILREDKSCDGEDEMELLTEKLYDSRKHLLYPTLASYTKPTMSSKRRQNYRQVRNNKCYPFITGQSTNQSYNLRVNIQQLKSLLKNKNISNYILQRPNTRKVSNNSVSAETPRPTKRSKYYCPAVVTKDLSEDKEIAKTICQSDLQLELANIDPNKLRPRCNCMAKDYKDYKEVIFDFHKTQFYNDENNEYMCKDFGECCSPKKQFAYPSSIKKNNTVYFNNVGSHPNYCMRDDQYNDKNKEPDDLGTCLMFNKVKTTSSVCLAALLHNIKQYQKRFEKIKTKTWVSRKELQININ
uniref:Uncharacterized protein n=1 Tax=Clastoptera arizonana TaxID=38151 RepID=A0A1B6DGV2_9HEMI